MAKIIRWNPYREMYNLVNSMDRLVDSDSVAARRGPQRWGLALDVAESEDEYLIKASLPGINPDDVDITLDKNVLTIKGEFENEAENEDENNEIRYHLRERRFGSFCRSLNLPTTVKADAIQATFDAGVLTLSLPKAEEAKPKRIEVKSAEKLLAK